MALYDFHRKNLAKAHEERAQFKHERDELLEGIEADRKAAYHPEFPDYRNEKLYALADRVKSKGTGGDADPALARKQRPHATRGDSDQVDGVAPESTSEPQTLHGLATWLVSMDQPDSYWCPRITLSQIIEVAKEALANPDAASLSSEASS